MNPMDDNPFQKLQEKNFNNPHTGLGDSSSQEELIEAIIEEKWEELLKDLSKLAEWKNTMTHKVLILEQKFEDLRREFDKVHSVIISKVDDYDKNISNVGAEIKAMEKVFSKVLPLFTENVAELAKITKDLKQPPRK